MKRGSPARCDSSDCEEGGSDSEHPDALAEPDPAVGARLHPHARAASSPARSIDALQQELNALPGLSHVKSEVAALIDVAKFDQQRRAVGLPSSSSSHHMVMIGSPGTCKTTVARLVGEIFRALGILARGHTVEVGRSDLVAGYTGQTALLVTKKFLEAKGGVLFIDEAYSLVGGERG